MTKMPTLPPLSTHPHILIIGAGLFGLTTALKLATTHQYTHITVLDRYSRLPAPDASSTDVSRAIRNDYADPLYARLATSALAAWQSDPVYALHFRQSGYVYSSSSSSSSSLGEGQGGEHPAKGGNAYLARARQNVRAAGLLPCDDFADAQGLRRLWPGYQGSPDDDNTPVAGYRNAAGGWADAAGAMEALVRRCGEAGVRFVAGTAVGFVSSPSSSRSGAAAAGVPVVQGVRLADGATLPADAVIVAAGAWTNQLLDMRGATTSAGQPVAFVQLTPDEAGELRDAPVFVDVETGWFCFPPTPETHLLKIVRHGWGYERRVEVEYDVVGGEKKGQRKRRRVVEVSSPDLAVRGKASAYLPEDAERDARAWMRKVWPRFAEREWHSTRLCWYSDTEDNDFIVDAHPDYRGVFLATAGSGHAFKFLPVIGKYVADCLLGTADAELREKWAFKPGTGGDFIGDGSRGGPKRRALDVVEKARL